MASFELESNNTGLTANPGVLGVQVGGQLSSSSDVDFFKYTVTGSTILNLSFISPLQDSANLFNISIYNDPNSSTPLYTNITGTSFSSFMWNAPVGDYYIAVSKADFYNSGQYAINVTSISSGNIIAENEVNDTSLTANAFALGNDVVGQISSQTDKDYFSFSAVQSVKYTLQFVSPTQDQADNLFKISVLDGSGNVISSHLTGTDLSFDFLPPTSGNYSIAVESSDFLDTQQYHFSVTAHVNVLNGGLIADL